MPKKRNFYKFVLPIFIFLVVVFVAISRSNSRNKDFLAEIEHKEEVHKFRLVGIVCSYLSRLYVEPERIVPKEMLREATSWLERIIPEVLVNIDEDAEEIQIFVNETSETIDTSRVRRLKDLYRTLSDILRFVNEHKSDKVKTEDIEYAAINGLLSQLDPHSIVFPPVDFKEFKIGTSGKFGGLGMVVGMRDGILTVISPIEGTPAYRANLKSGDKIFTIDEDSTINMSLQEAVSKLRGDPSTKVILTIENEKSGASKTVTLTREIIEIPTVTSKLLADNIGYIKVRNFQEDTSESLDEQIEQLSGESGGLKGIILDLRFNSGGLLDQAIAVSDKFLSSGIVVVTVGPKGRHQELKKARKDTEDLVEIPIVAIINAGSASGAEIVAGALKDNNRAVLIGDLSFGKGSIQQLINLLDGAALKLTIGKYLTPSFTDIQSIGITPDIMLSQTNVTEDEVIMFNEDLYSREKDLRKHLDESTKTEKPLEKIKYLVKKDDKTQEEKDESYYNLPDLTEDTHVRFARTIILKSVSSNRKEILKQLMPVVDDFKDSEMEKISSSLDAIGVDWSTGKTGATPVPAVSLSVNGGEFKAGEDVEIEVTVTNTGEGTLYQLRGITESKNPLLDKHEFLLGKIGKGEKKTSLKKIKLPENIVSRKDEFVVKFSELNGYVPEDVKSTLSIEALPRPVFAYSFQIIDEGAGLCGNGDGIIQKGEEIELVLLVKNVGQGTSEKNIVALRDLNHKEIFIKKSKLELGKLLPGELKSFKLGLSVRDTLDADSFSVKITIADTTYGSRISDKMIFPVGHKSDAGPMQSVDKMLRVTGERAAIHNGVSSETPVVAYVNKGEILKADKESGTWIRIGMADNRFGWISCEDIENILPDGVHPADGALPSDGEHYLVEDSDLYMNKIPPSVHLDKETLHEAYELDHLPISGTVRDDKKVQYVYVLANDDKVFYKAGNGSIENGTSVLPFSCNVPLKEGQNVISVITRDDQDLLSSKSFVITRK
ncbi:MAG: PDZ domain-containing protein [Planctomycetes bacterium]|nr:PDZ domain-containing protein [Planctomycetota bacterium]